MLDGTGNRREFLSFISCTMEKVEEGAVNIFREKYPPEIREWWEKTLKSPKMIVAPMVDASELAWRMLSRRYNADLCFTPMFHSRIFTEEIKYRTDNLYNDVCPEDRPLIVQFCGNDANVLVKAAEMAKPYCDGVDINLGCPQAIAKKGHYGAFLMEEWDRIFEIVKRIREEVKIPVSCKIRVFTDINKTVEYAKKLERAGCFMLTVHGRTILQKGPNTGIASWEHIKAVRNAVSIPVVANGNIQYLDDVERCIKETGVEGVMSAEGNLHNPKLFTGDNPPVWEMGLEYIELAKKYPCPMGYTRGHLFKLYNHILSLPENDDLRQKLAKTYGLDNFTEVSRALKSRYEAYVTGELTWVTPENNKEIEKLRFPPYICQPYVRPPLKPQKDSIDDHPKLLKTISQDLSESGTTSTQNHISKKQLKRIQRKPHKKWGADRIPLPLCSACVNPVGQKCAYTLCRRCCSDKCYNESLDCVGHKTLIKTNREKAQLFKKGEVIA